MFDIALSVTPILILVMSADFRLVAQYCTVMSLYVKLTFSH